MQFLPVSNIEHVDDLVALIEILTAITGETRLSEWPFDEDLLAETYTEYVAQNKSEGGQVQADYLLSEPATAREEAKKFALEAALEQISENMTLLGDSYPIRFHPKTRFILAKHDELDAVGQAYLWLKLFEVTNSENNYVQFSTEEKNTFYKLFVRTFEYLAAMATMGKTKSRGWMSSASRSFRDLLAILNDLSMSIGSGKVKIESELTESQRKANDGGFDCIAVEEYDAVIKAHSQLYLVSATIQKTDLGNKTIGAGEITRFDDFFSKRITLSKKGVLVVPHGHNIGAEERCSEANCVYISKDEIHKLIADAKVSSNFASIASAFLDERSWPPNEIKFDTEQI